MFHDDGAQVLERGHPAVALLGHLDVGAVAGRGRVPGHRRVLRLGGQPQSVAGRRCP